MKNAILALVIALPWAAAGPTECHRTKAYVALSPIAVMVPPGEVRHAAEYYASLRPGSIVLTGEGAGMQPIYPSGTLLVVEPIPYKSLQQGMTVVFLSDTGQRVAHYLITELPNGWVTRGLNLDEDDPGLLTADRYLGAVVMAFAPDQKLQQ